MWRAAGKPSLSVKQEEKKVFLESRVRAVNYKLSNTRFRAMIRHPIFYTE